jgi:uncharacterized RDD family membrane protein YckC
MDKSVELKYAGFWVRVGAFIIDSILIVLVIFPILWSIYGSEYFKSEKIIYGFWDFVISWVFPAIAVIVFWIYRSATPGKIALGLKIIDADTGEKPSLGQCIIRYLGYYVSIFPLCLGLIWVGFDKKKQGWHDKLAGTYVIIDD